MNEEVIVSIISGLFTLAGVIITVLYGNKKTKDKIQEQTDLTAYRIEQLELKQDRHNQVIERMYRAEDEIHIMQEKIRVQNHRIDDLETFHKPQ